MPPQRDPAAYLDWLTSDPQAGRVESEELLSFPSDGWDDYLAEHPHTLNWHAVQRLLRRAHELLAADPGQSAAITELLVRHLDRLANVPGTEVAIEMQRIAVWRERAEALNALGDLPGALAAAEQGIAAAVTPERHYLLEKAQVRRVLAVVLHQTGRDLEALRILQEDLAVFDEHDHEGEVLRSLIILGDMELTLGHLPRAHATLQRALALAVARGEEAQQQVAAEKLAVCEMLMGHGGRAASGGR